MKIPEPIHQHTTATAIVRWYEKTADQAPRPHLGCSEIGKPCDRALWYNFRWCSDRKFDGRMLRLFNTGQREEARFLEELRGIGAEVYDVDPDTGHQHRFAALGGHFAGSCDAIGRGLPEAPKSWAIIEMKTHNAKSFAELVKKGVKEHKPEHYAQMQAYMDMAELDRALYIACNKDTDELHTEWIHYNQSEAISLLARAQRIINAVEPLERMHQDPAFYLCKWCDHHAICHGEKVAQRSCRTCIHATPSVEHGTWRCESQNRDLSVDEQRLGCRSHLFIPSLIPYAEPQDAGADWIKYQHKDGSIFANVTEDADRSEENMTNDITACYTSAELVVTVAQLVGDPVIAEIKETFPGARVASSSECPF